MPQRPPFTLPRPGLPTILTSPNAASTRRLAARLARNLEGGTVVALTGELGAGKTSFVQGLAQGLAVPELQQVLSPTYTLVNEYPGGRLTLVHIDFYRLRGDDAARGLGVEEQVGRSDCVTAIEWADMLPTLIPATALWVQLTRVDESGSRRILLRVGE